MSFFPNSKVNSRQRYQPNLVNLMTLCANNYNLLLKLQANKTQRHQQRDFFINDRLAYVIVVKEVTPYTSLLTFEQKTPTPQLSKHSYHPRMSIRLYHDARMAEVISSQGIQQVKPRYDYPNQHMHQQDEKQQINQFLNEWLQLCLAHGQVKVELKNCQ